MAQTVSGRGDTTAASVGAALAAVALVAASLRWTGAPATLLGQEFGSVAAAGLAVGAAAAFLARRYGFVGRSVGAPLAALLSAGVLGVAVFRLVWPVIDGGPEPSVGLGLVLAAAAGVAGIIAAVADFRAIPFEELAPMATASAWATFSGIAALLIGQVAGAVGIYLGFALVGTGETTSTVFSTVGFGIGLLGYTALALRQRGLGWDYVDIEWPSLRDVGYAIGGVVGLFVLLAVVSAVIQGIGLPSTSSSIEDRAASMANPEFLLALIPLSLLVIGPGEELVYRNLVQKRLYERFSPVGAIVVASIIFALVHIPQYALTSGGPVGVLTTLIIIFLLALFLGTLYYRTENVLVPAVVHGTFNAIQFAALYVTLA